MNRIKDTIGWADFSWNPITGCSPVSEGCDHCYAAAISKRFDLPWGDPVFHPERLGEPFKRKKPAKIFCSSMSDLFHESVEWNALFAVWQMMGMVPWHTFIVLTKRPGRAHKELSRWGNLAVHLQRQSWCRKWPLPNVWLGVSAENQARANERIPELMRMPAAKRVVSVEPMLGRVFLPGMALNGVCLDGLSWVIAGPETGPGRRRCEPGWIEDLAGQCRIAGVPFYDKRENYTRREWPKQAGK